MVKIDKKNRIIFVSGIVRWKMLVAAVNRAQRGCKDTDWPVIALPDPDTTNITCGMAFSPPDVRHEVAGFRRPKDAEEPQ